MSRTIWKYPVPIDDSFVLKMPTGAVPIHFAMQGDQPTLWAMVDAARPVVSYRLWLVGTGHPADHVLVGDYIGTVQERQFVWHLFWHRTPSE